MRSNIVKVPPAAWEAEVVAVAATDRWPVLALLTVLACSEGGLRIAPPELDEGTSTTSESDATEPGSLDEGEDAFDEGEGEDAFDEGELDEGELDEGEDGEEYPVLVEPGGVWRYMTGDNVDADWIAPEFDDGSWSSGPAPLGHGMPVTTEVPSEDGQPTAWFRVGFELVDPSVIPGLDLRLRRDDGAIAYLNGTVVLRSNMPSGSITPVTKAATEAQDADEHHYIRAFPDISLLRVGGNVLAVEIHDRKTDPKDRVIDAQLKSVDPDQPPTELEFRVRTVTYDGKYGPRNVGAIWIEHEDGTFVRTLEVWGDVRREHLVVWRTASDEDDTDAMTASTLESHGTHVAIWDLLDLDGQPVDAGGYRVRVEFTEANSNDNAAAGPNIEVAFELGGPPDRVEVAGGDTEAFTDLLLWAP
jgi:hypothetical protein